MADLYRVGNHNPRNIYRGDQHIGVVFSPADGPLVVAALNADGAEPRRCSDCGRAARELAEWWQDGVKLWLGPTCLRRRQVAAASGVQALPLGGAR